MQDISTSVTPSTTVSVGHLASSEKWKKVNRPVGPQPLVWHSFSASGTRYLSIEDYFLNYLQTAYSDCISDFGKKVEMLGQRPPDWRVRLWTREFGATSGNGRWQCNISLRTRRSFSRI